MEKDFRTILLPGLLEHQQQQQEDFITTWKGIVLEAANVGDWTAAKFQDIQRRVEASLKNVNPAEEYREFTERNKYVCVTAGLSFLNTECTSNSFCPFRTEPARLLQSPSNSTRR